MLLYFILLIIIALTPIIEFWSFGNSNLAPQYSNTAPPKMIHIDKLLTRGILRNFTPRILGILWNVYPLHEKYIHKHAPACMESYESAASPPQMFIARNISNYEVPLLPPQMFIPRNISNHEEYIHWTRTRVHGNYCRTALSGKCSLKVVHSDLIGISAQSDKKF